MAATLIDGILESLRIGVGFLWTAAWAISMGLTVTSLVQVYVSKERMANVLGEIDLTTLTKLIPVPRAVGNGLQYEFIRRSSSVYAVAS